MRTELSKLQYITDSAKLAEAACTAGVRWVQARIKNRGREEIKATAMEILSVCRKHDAVCVVNDFAEIALEIGADGVHLGREDMEVTAARALAGSRPFLIGGTANTIEDLRQLALLHADYIGLGPFRFTTTKTKLSPVLGTEGFRQIMNQTFNANMYYPPVFAIGGILPGDAAEIISTGIYGVAVSGAISAAADKEKTVKQFYQSLHASSHAE